MKILIMHVTCFNKNFFLAGPTKALANLASEIQNLLARLKFHWPRPVGQRGFGSSVYNKRASRLPPKDRRQGQIMSAE